MPALTRSAKKRLEEGGGQGQGNNASRGGGVRPAETLITIEPTAGGGTHTRWLRGEAALKQTPPNSQAASTSQPQQLQPFVTPIHLVLGQPTAPPPIERNRRKSGPKLPENFDQGRNLYNEFGVKASNSTTPPKQYTDALPLQSPFNSKNNKESNQQTRNRHAVAHSQGQNPEIPAAFLQRTDTVICNDPPRGPPLALLQHTDTLLIGPDGEPLPNQHHHHRR